MKFPEIECKYFNRSCSLPTSRVLYIANNMNTSISKLFLTLHTTVKYVISFRLQTTHSIDKTFLCGFATCLKGLFHNLQITLEHFNWSQLTIFQLHFLSISHLQHHNMSLLSFSIPKKDMRDVNIIFEVFVCWINIILNAAVKHESQPFIARFIKTYYI